MLHVTSAQDMGHCARIPRFAPSCSSTTTWSAARVLYTNALGDLLSFVLIVQVYVGQVHA